MNKFNTCRDIYAHVSARSWLNLADCLAKIAAKEGADSEEKGLKCMGCFVVASSYCLWLCCEQCDAMSVCSV